MKKTKIQDCVLNVINCVCNEALNPIKSDIFVIVYIFVNLLLFKKKKKKRLTINYQD